MADSVKPESRSKERSRSRTTSQKKGSNRASATSKSGSSTGGSNVSVKRKSTSCSKDKRRKSRRYSSSSGSSSSSSGSSSSRSSVLSTPRKDDSYKDPKHLKKSSYREVDESAERKKSRSRDRSIRETRKTEDCNPSRSRSRSARKNDEERKPSSRRPKSESCHREERRHGSNSKDGRSGGEKRPRDCYGDRRNSAGPKWTEGASRNNEDRNSGGSGHWEGTKGGKRIEDSSSNRGTQGSREHSLSLGRNEAKKSKKRRSTTSDSSSSSTGSSSSDESKAEKARKKRKKAAARKLKKAEKKRRKKERKLKKKLKKIKPKETQEVKEEKIPQAEDQSSSNDRLLNDIPPEVIERAKAMAPMTKEQWEKKQSIVRRVYDEETGRHRLIKGGGEVLEEIVSRDRHREINRQATRGDGEFFQSQLRLAK